MTGEFTPFNYPVAERGSPSKAPVAAGPFVEVVKVVCARMRYECRIELYPWQRALVLAEQGAADGIFATLRTPERDEVYFFTPPLVMTSNAVYAHRSNPLRYGELEDLSGHSVHVYGPSGTARHVRKRLEGIADVQLHMEIDNQRLMRKLDAGRFGDGLVIMNRDVAQYLIQQDQLHQVQEVGLFERIGYSIAFSRKQVSEQTFQAFNRNLAALIADGTIPAIIQRYQLEPAEPVQGIARNGNSDRQLFFLPGP